MYAGYVFVCSTESLGDCLRRKVFSCSGEAAEAARGLAGGSVVFLFNADSDTLVGPFTAVGSARSGLEPGAWTEVLDNPGVSENIGVEWEELHQIGNAREEFPLLKDLKTCKLSRLQLQDLLDALKKGALFSVPRGSARKRR
jgi:hypothetical protein